jgi:alpha-L-rhamnosidase
MCLKPGRVHFAVPITVTLIILLLKSFNAKAQTVDPALLQTQWKASWITVPQANPTGYGVYYFRKDFELASIPGRYRVHVSADNRYKLFVNEKLVSLGPARGDLLHWNFETVDLSPFLRIGKNVIAAQVWNEGEQRMEANISLRTGFILQGSEDAQAIKTNDTWKCARDSGYSPLKVTMATYYVTGPGEQIDMKSHIRDWEKIEYKDSGWQNAQIIFAGVPKHIIGGYGSPNGWMLTPSAIPPMELKKERLLKLRMAEGIVVPASFPATPTAITIPANTTATLILDQTYLTNAYATMIISGGKAASVFLGYAEALFTKYPAKEDRDDIDGKKFLGRKDIIISDGSKGQTFTSLSFRTYRYIELVVTTKNDPLVIEDLYGTFTGYPFQFNAKLQTDNTELTKMLEIGWRTARLCAFETYMDCPYYEQLQYIGDARIQGLISLYNSGDDRLLLNAINQMDNSRQPEGITLSRHPSSTPQYINTFSLWYIGMLHDYMMYGRNVSFIQQKLAGERQVLNYFRIYQQPDGSLKDVPYWSFTDWVNAKGWKDGRGPVDTNGNSALLDMQLLWAYQVAADLENKIGMKAYGSLYTQYAEQLKITIRKKYWDSGRKMFSDVPDKSLFSQHANALAILTGLVSKDQAQHIGKQLLSDTTLAPASIYFKYYLHQALVKAGFGNDYLGWLDKWRENIKMGLTTWAEISEVSEARSDCHAWGASPNIEFFRTILGIDSDAPGFARLKIEPHLGTIRSIAGEVPHPNGKVRVSYDQNNGHIKAEISLPSNTTGAFIWKSKAYPLKEGKNSINL